MNSTCHCVGLFKNANDNVRLFHWCIMNFRRELWESVKKIWRKKSEKPFQFARVLRVRLNNTPLCERKMKKKRKKKINSREREISFILQHLHTMREVFSLDRPFVSTTPKITCVDCERKSLSLALSFTFFLKKLFVVNELQFCVWNDWMKWKKWSRIENNDWRIFERRKKINKIKLFVSVICSF